MIISQRLINKHGPKASQHEVFTLRFPIVDASIGAGCCVMSSEEQSDEPFFWLQEAGVHALHKASQQTISGMT
jgi:hypothetical protein